MYGILGEHIQDLIRPPRRLPGAKPGRPAPPSSGSPRPLRYDERPLGGDARRPGGGHPRGA